MEYNSNKQRNVDFKKNECINQIKNSGKRNSSENYEVILASPERYVHQYFVEKIQIQGWTVKKNLLCLKKQLMLLWVVILLPRV